MKQVIILIIMATSMLCVIDFLEKSNADKTIKQIAFFIVPILLFLVDYFYLNQVSIDLFGGRPCFNYSLRNVWAYTRPSKKYTYTR